MVLLVLLLLPTAMAMAVAVGAEATRTSARRRERVLRGAFKFGAFIPHDNPKNTICVLFWEGTND